MKLWKSLQGKLNLWLTCADPVALLNTITDSGIVLKNAVYQSDLELSVTIFQSDYHMIQKICEKNGATVRIVEKIGIYWRILGMQKRPVLLLFFGIILMMGLLLPSRILFVQVEGNVRIPTKQILEAASECGISFGAVRRNVRSEVMKNALLEKIPDIQWAGVNTVGCTAVISVKEKTAQDSPQTQSGKISSIIASRDGVIQDCTVLEGNPLCSVGQAVKKGQTLVSGYLDSGLLTRTTCAKAEVKALTFRQLHAISIKPAREKGVVQKEVHRYSIRIGKKLINLYKDSGILSGTCDKMYLEEYVVLPGGFSLPVSLIKETILYHDEAERAALSENQDEWLRDAAQDYLLSDMIAGQIISSETELQHSDEMTSIYGQYMCVEMIGQVKYEDTLLRDEEHD